MGEKPSEQDEEGRMAAMNMQRPAGEVPQPAEATTVKSSKSNSSESAGGPGPGPAESTSVKSSKSNSQD